MQLSSASLTESGIPGTTMAQCPVAGPCTAWCPPCVALPRCLLAGHPHRSQPQAVQQLHPAHICPHNRPAVWAGHSVQTAHQLERGEGEGGGRGGEGEQEREGRLILGLTYGSYYVWGCCSEPGGPVGGQRTATQAALWVGQGNPLQITAAFLKPQ